MKMQMQQFFSVVVVMATWMPLPAAAEMPGTAACASPSWNGLVSGDCGISGASTVRQPRHAGTDSATQLVIEVPMIPEPETYALMLLGLVAVVVAARRRRRD